MTREFHSNAQDHAAPAVDLELESDHDPEIARRTSLIGLEREANKPPPDLLGFAKKEGSSSKGNAAPANPAASNDRIRDEARDANVNAFRLEVRWVADRMLVASTTIATANDAGDQQMVKRERTEVLAMLQRLSVMAAVVPLKEQDVLEDLAKLREAKDKLSSRLEAAKTHLGDTSLGASEVDEAVTAVAKAAHLDSKILGRDAIDPKAEHEPASRNAALSALIVAAEKDVDALASALQANTNPEVALGWLEVSLDHVWKLVANDPKARKTHAKQVARIAKAFNAIKPTLEQRTRPHRLGAVTGLLEAIRK